MAMLRDPLTLADHIRGPANAPATLVEYGDYECPHCGLSHVRPFAAQQKIQKLTTVMAASRENSKLAVHTEGKPSCCPCTGSREAFRSLRPT